MKNNNVAERTEEKMYFHKKRRNKEIKKKDSRMRHGKRNREMLTLFCRVLQKIAVLREHPHNLLLALVLVREKLRGKMG